MSKELFSLIAADGKSYAVSIEPPMAGAPLKAIVIYAKGDEPAVNEFLQAATDIYKQSKGADGSETKQRYDALVLAIAMLGGSGDGYSKEEKHAASNTLLAMVGEAQKYLMEHPEEIS